jgi:hypothetical protein
MINKKFLSYYHDYGIIKTNLKTKLHNQLNLGFECICIKDASEYGQLIFETSNAQNNLPEHLFETSILINKNLLECLHVELEAEMRKEFGFHSFSYKSITSGQAHEV